LNKNLRKVKWFLRIVSNKLQFTLYNNSVTNIKWDVFLDGGIDVALNGGKKIFLAIPGDSVSRSFRNDH